MHCKNKYKALYFPFNLQVGIKGKRFNIFSLTTDQLIK